ncbi:MAG: DUF3078 domain-containing protein [bacterium]
MMRCVTLVSLFWVAISSSIVMAQDKPDEKKPIVPGPWNLGATVGLNLAQSAFSSNWAGGDKGSFVWVARSDLTAERQLNMKVNLANTLQLAYGQTSRQITDPNNPNENVWDSPDKTTDLLQLESTARFTLQKFVDPYLAFRFDSQFVDQTSPFGNIHFNPVRLKETAGVARVFEKTEDREFISRFGFGFRQIGGRSFVDSTAEETQSSWTNDGGFEWQTDMTRPVLEKRVLYKGKLLVYLPIFYSKSGDLDDFDAAAIAFDPSREEVGNFWQSPDVNFQNTFTAKITKYLNVDLYLQWVYDRYDEATPVDLSRETGALIAQVDRGVRKRGQFKQVLSLGLSYALF